MNFWLIWHSLAMITLVSASLTAGFITCKAFDSKKLKLKKIKDQ